MLIYVALVGGANAKGGETGETVIRQAERTVFHDIAAGRAVHVLKDGEAIVMIKLATGTFDVQRILRPILTESGVALRRARAKEGEQTALTGYLSEADDNQNGNVQSIMYTEHGRTITQSLAYASTTDEYINTPATNFGGYVPWFVVAAGQANAGAHVAEGIPNSQHG